MATVFTSAGEEVIVDLVDGTTATHLDDTNGHIGWGTGADTADKADTTLSTEASESRVTVTTTQSAADTHQWVATIVADGTKTITNAGLLNNSVGGALVVFGDFTGIPLVANDSIEFTITLQYA